MPSSHEFMMELGRRPGWPGRVMRKRALARRTAAEVAGVADEILEFLGTGRLRDVKEIAEAVGLPDNKVERILDFLAQTGFIRKGVQITRLGSNFIKLPIEKWGRRL